MAACANCNETIGAYYDHWDSFKTVWKCHARDYPKSQSEPPTPEPMPIVVCDRCMCEADLEEYNHSQYERRLIIKCHEEWQVVRWQSLPKQVNKSKPWKFLWSAVEEQFINDRSLANEQTAVLNNALSNLSSLATIQRIRIAQKAAQLKLPADMIDPIADLLLLFRTDKPA